MKWDLVVQRWGSGLAVTEFHLSPVSPFIPFNKYAQESLLNYTHSYNIRSLFQKIKGYFWSSGENPDLKGPWPVLTDEPVDSHCSFYEAGASRAVYGVHAKQFEMLVPLHLEHIGEDQSLQIELQVLSKDEEENINVINTCVLDLREDPSMPDFHNRFCRYLKEWLQKIGIQSEHGQKDIMEVNLENKSAWISGVDVTSGDLTQKDVTNSLINNLLYRERPLMETDSILTNIFKDNNMVLSQLFNLNICFNAEDIMPANICQMVYGAPLNMFAKASLQSIGEDSDPEYLPLKDIFSNYEYIPRKKLQVTRIHSMETSNIGGGLAGLYSEESEQEAPNVFDYLLDTKSVDLIDKNRNVQSIVHWSLQDNPSYLFNLYGGFGGYYEYEDEGETQIGLVQHNYGDTPDPGAAIPSRAVEYSDCLWATLIELYPNQLEALLTPNYSWEPAQGSEWEEGIDTPEDEIYEKATDPNTGWLSNYKLMNIPSEKVYKIVLVHIIPYPETDDTSINSTRYIKLSSDPNNNLHWAESAGDKRLIYFASNIWKDLTWASASRTIQQYTPGEEEITGNLDDLKEHVFNKIQIPELISFTRSIAFKKAPGPSLRVREIQWVKDDNADPNQNYILRYGGRIVPSLIDEDDSLYRNYAYYKDQISGTDDDSGSSRLQKSVYGKWIRSGLTPKYPSIGFSTLRKIYEDYSNNPVSPVSNDPGQRLCPLFERKHWRDSSLLILRPHARFSIQLVREDGTEFSSIEADVRKYLIENIYGLDNADPIAGYIWSLYGYEYDFEYDYSKADESDPQAWKDNYIFNVTATLK